MKTKIQNLLKIATFDITEANNSQMLAEVKAKHLGKNSLLSILLKGLAKLEPRLRAETGKIVNETKNSLNMLIMEKQKQLEKDLVIQNLNKEAIDVTLPIRRKIGHLHPITQTSRNIENIFVRMGFVSIEGPEVENEYNNSD